MAAPSLLSSSSIPKFLMQTLTLIPPPFSRTIFSPLKIQLSTLAVGCRVLSTSPTINPLPISGSEDALMGFVTGKSKATEVAHSAWKNLVRKGDTVIDATCGNGYDTLALLKMVADESGRGCVYGMDIQSSALESTSSLLEVSTDENKRKQVQLLLLCHSKMEEVVPRDTRVRLVAFNLGYLPGGDRTIITRSSTTLLALQAASRILDSGGLISIVAYVGHPGGRDEYETVESFASNLPMESWIGCKFEMLNRPTCPVLLFLFKK